MPKKTTGNHLPGTLLILLCLALLTACEMPVVTQTSSGLLATPTDLPPNYEPGIRGTPNPLQTEEVSVTLEAREADIYTGIRPDNQHVYFWYSLPPQSQADLALNKVVDSFNQSNSYNIFIDAYNQSTATDFLSRLKRTKGNPDQPSVALMDAYLAWQLQEQDLLIDLVSFKDHPLWGFAQNQVNQFQPAILNLSSSPLVSLAQPGYPLGSGTSLIYYNETWLGQLGYTSPPQSFESFEEAACKAAKQPFQQAGQGMVSGFVLQAGAESLLSWAHAYGAQTSYADSSGYQLNTAEVRSSLLYLRKLARLGCLTLVDSPEELHNAFAEGRALFIQDSSTAVLNYAQTIAVNSFSWSIFPLPSTSGSILLNPSGSYLLGLLEQSPEQELAGWLFLRYALDDSGQQTWARSSGQFPLYKNAGPLVGIHPAYSRALSLLENAAAPAWQPFTPQMDQQFAASMQAILADSPFDQEVSRMDALANSLLLDLLKQP